MKRDEIAELVKRVVQALPEGFEASLPMIFEFKLVEANGVPEVGWFRLAAARGPGEAPYQFPAVQPNVSSGWDDFLSLCEPEVRPDAVTEPNVR